MHMHFCADIANGFNTVEDCRFVVDRARIRRVLGLASRRVRLSVTSKGFADELLAWSSRPGHLAGIRGRTSPDERSTNVNRFILSTRKYI